MEIDVEQNAKLLKWNYLIPTGARAVYHLIVLMTIER
jgi:hypothetical protein